MRIDLSKFDGIIPGTDPRNLPDTAAQAAENVDLYSSTLETIKAPNDIETLGDTSQIAAYLWRFMEHKLVGGTSAETTAATWAALTSTGWFQISIDGTEYDINPDFTGDTTMAHVATTIQTAIRARWQYSLTCGTAGDATAANWAAITGAGRFTLSIGGTEYEDVDPDFTGDTTMAEVATSIQVAIRAKTGSTEYVKWSTDHFIVYASDTITHLSAPTTETDLSTSSWINGVTGTLDNSKLTAEEVVSWSTDHFIIYSNYTLTACSAPDAGTDLSSATYMDCTSGASTLTNSESNDWLTWTTDVDVIENPVADDAYDRIYYTGSGVPKVKGYDAGTATEYNMKIPAPTTAPTCAEQAEFAFGAIYYRIWNQEDTNLDVVATLVREEQITDHTVNRKWQFTADTSLVEHAGDTYYVQCYIVTTPQGGSAANLIAQNCNYLAAQTPLPSPAPVTELEYETTGNVIRLTQRASWSSWDNAGTDQVRINVVLEIEERFIVNPNTTYLYYCYTFVSSWGEEGPPSALSEIHIRKPGYNVTVANMDAVEPSRNITHKRIYRTVRGGESDDFRFVKEVTLATASYVDISADSDTGEVMIANSAPDDDLFGLCLMSGSFFAAFKGREVWFSEPEQPYSWPTKYRRTLGYDIVGGKVSGNDLVVVTKGTPYLLTGSHPDRISETQLMLHQAGSAKRGIVKWGNNVLYPSPDGMVKIAGAYTDLLTWPWTQRAEWQALTPSSILAAVHDEKLFAFATGDNYILVLGRDDSTLSTYEYTSGENAVQGLSIDIQNDALYLIQSNKLTQWNASSTVKKLTWRSKQFAYARPVSFSCARVMAASYPTSNQIKFRGRTDGTQRFEITVTSEKPFRLPWTQPKNLWSFEIESYVGVGAVTMATSMDEI